MNSAFQGRCRWIRVLLELNLVGAINYYGLKLTFSESGKTMTASLRERTGLNDEQLSGAASP